MSRQRLQLTALLLLLAGPVLAQRFTAAIRGTVTDPSTAVIAGAKVTIKNEETGLARTVTTNEAGNYFFPDLPVGSYQVEVMSSGLKSEVRTPGRCLAPQEHPSRLEGEAPAPFRVFQRVQHGQLPGVFAGYGLHRAEGRVRHRERGHGYEDRQRGTPGDLRATPPRRATPGRCSGASG